MENRLLALLYKISGEKKPRDGETIWRALCRVAWWYYSKCAPCYPKTDALWEALIKAKPSKITHDGYLAKYSVLYDQCWPAIVEDAAAYGIVLTVTPVAVRLSYKHLPEIFVEVPNRWTGREIDVFPKLPFDDLYRCMIYRYGTPYQEEVMQLQLVAKLSQPIAEAISDCIMAVIERRYLHRTAPLLSYLDKKAGALEIEYTAHEFDMDFREPDALVADWENYLVPRAESSSESSEDNGWSSCQARGSCYGGGYDEW